MARFDRLSRSYDKMNPYRTGDKLVRHLRPMPHHTILDVGGGTGQVGEALGFRPHRYVVVDPSPGMNEQARSKRPWIRTLRGDGAKLPFVDDSVDRVVMVDALHHVPDQDACLAEIRRVLRPTGRVVVQEFRMDRWWRRFLLVGCERLARFGSRFRREHAWQEAFTRAGFRVEAVERVSWSDVMFVLAPARN